MLLEASTASPAVCLAADPYPEAHCQEDDCHALSHDAECEVQASGWIAQPCAAGPPQDFATAAPVPSELHGGCVPGSYSPRLAPSLRASPPHESKSARSPSSSQAPLTSPPPPSSSGSPAELLSPVAAAWKRAARLSGSKSRLPSSSTMLVTPRRRRHSAGKPLPDTPIAARTSSVGSQLSSSARACATKASLLHVMAPTSSSTQKRRPWPVSARFSAGRATRSMAST
mmetsp:Transcript_142646/g.397485  ORF Transcript_142646/g.397485 Transcript_142646/m.397485 type:complete len:228 (-) Transcript_142646:378-1061(-)